MTPEYSRGWFNAMDKIANLINSMDTSTMTKEQIRSIIYKECMSLAG